MKFIKPPNDFPFLNYLRNKCNILKFINKVIILGVSMNMKV